MVLFNEAAVIGTVANYPTPDGSIPPYPTGAAFGMNIAIQKYFR